MHYFRSYRFAFSSPNWAMNLLMLIVCKLIPILGDIVLIGYFFEVIEYMHRRGSDVVYPDFNFNRFVKYLVRGVWAFLAIFLMQFFVMMPTLLLGYFAIVFSWIMVSEKQLPAETAAIITVVAVAVALLVGLLIGLISMPVYLKAGLQQEFLPAFSLSFFRDFYGRIGFTVILTLLFKFVTAPFVFLAGVLLCFIGMFPAEIVIIYSQHHLLYQLYREYLRAGGMPIPLKPEDLETEKDYGEEVIDDPSRAPE